MPQSTSVPTYRRHRQSGQAIVTLPDGLGRRKDFLLGEHGTKASRLEYARRIAEWEAAGRRLPQSVAKTDLTINELLIAFWRHAEQHYRLPSGEPTSELRDYKYTLKPLKALYGHTPANQFGPMALKAVRAAMIKAELCRNVVNQRINRIRRVFKWGVENELVPPSILHGLQAVMGLQRGRTEATESTPVRPVSTDVVEATLPHLNRHVAGIVRTILLTGARPGEICAMRGADIEMTGKAWVYRPARHKTAHHGKERAILIGPKAQTVLRPFLRLELDAPLFSPALAVAEIMEERRANRQSPRTPSQDRRDANRAKNAGKRRRPPKIWYTSMSINVAIGRACLAANQPKWHANQLRHARATELRRELGVDAARAILGHTTAATTMLYAEADLAKSSEIMARLG